jgi:hypothetical protein
VEVLHKNETRQFTIFEKESMDIFGQIDLSSSEDDVLTTLVSQLPVEINGKISRNNLYDIQKI